MGIITVVLAVVAAMIRCSRKAWIKHSAFRAAVIQIGISELILIL